MGDEALRIAARRYQASVRALAERDLDSRLTYFEESPTKNHECFLRWKELNDAGVQLSGALGDA